GGDFVGGTVNLAARICAAAGPGEIFIAETTRYVAGRIESIDYVDRGLHELKGVQEPQRLIEVRWQPSVAEAPSGAQEAEIAATIERSIDVLNRVLSITHTDDPGFRPLVECQTKARDLRLRLSRSASVQGQSAQRIQDEITPYADLVTLLGERDTLEEQPSAPPAHAAARPCDRPPVIADAEPAADPAPPAPANSAACGRPPTRTDVGASAEGDRGPLWACRSPPTRGAAADGGGRPARRGRALVGDRALGLERVEVVRHRVGLRASWCPRPAPAPARRADPGERRVRRRAAGRQLLLALRPRRAPAARG